MVTCQLAKQKHLPIFQNTHHNTTSKQNFKNIETSFQKDKHPCKTFKQELLQWLARQGIFFTPMGGPILFGGQSCVRMLTGRARVIV